MAAELNVYFGISEVSAGVPLGIDIAPLHDPIKPIEITDDLNKYQEFTIPAGETVQLWAYTEGDTFEMIALVIQGQEGYLQLAWEVNKPTSTTNFAPDGTTHRRINQCDMSCFAPFVLSADECLVNPVLADATGLDGSSLPSIFSDAGTIDGRVYKLWAKNPSLTDAVKVKMYARN